MKGIFLQRSGIALAAEHARQPRPAPRNARPVAQAGTPDLQNRLFDASAQFCDHTTGGGAGSWQDTARDWCVAGESPFTSFRCAAAAAQLAQFLADMSGVTATTEVECAQLSRRPST